MIIDKIKEIQNIIKPFKSKWKNLKDDKVSEADINWNASIFFSKSGFLYRKFVYIYNFYTHIG